MPSNLFSNNNTVRVRRRNTPKTNASAPVLSSACPHRIKTLLWCEFNVVVIILLLITRINIAAASASAAVCWKRTKIVFDIAPFSYA